MTRRNQLTCMLFFLMFCYATPLAIAVDSYNREGHSWIMQFSDTPQPVKLYKTRDTAYVDWLVVLEQDAKRKGQL